jgi:type IX secretion system PorP/SprF family membrane protein
MLSIAKKTLSIAFLIFICTIQLRSQDLGFSQFYSNQLYLNPAFSGNPRYARFSMAYRNQWLQGATPYATYGASYDKYFASKNSGLGFNLINDVQDHGVFNRASFDIMYSYTFQVAYNAQIKGGLQLGAIYKTINTSKLIFPDMIDQTGTLVGNVGQAGKSHFSPDIAAGVVGQWDIYYGGVAVHHIAEPTEVEAGAYKAQLPRRYTAHLGCDITFYKRYLLRNTLTVSPNVIYITQNGFHQINLGCYLMRNEMVFGMWIRENTAFTSTRFTVIAGYYTEDYRIGYSYDFSMLKGGFRGIKTSTHEVTFGKNFQYKVKSRKKNRPILNPKF